MVSILAAAARRFIPACAGNSHNWSKSGFRKPVHPRVCGEQRYMANAVLVLVGSSPRVRGTAEYGKLHNARLRFIPACAGNRATSTTPLVFGSVHPRVCGEQTSQILLPCSTYGSSPRVRGTEPPCQSFFKKVRFIPACAGNSKSSRSGNFLISVHPRVCGEQPRVLSMSNSQVGSSPRVRGTDFGAPPGVCKRRFIPACAGNRSGPRSARPYAPVHPRVCGEQYP